MMAIKYSFCHNFINILISSNYLFLLDSPIHPVLVTRQPESSSQTANM